MSVLEKFRNIFVRSPTPVSMAKLVTERGNGVYSWNGKIYQSDVVRSCIRPFARSIGKLDAQQIRDNGENIKVNPDRYIKALLDEPNPMMTGQMLQEKLATLLALNNNAFALIVRDAGGYASQIYPIAAYNAEAIYDADMNLFLRFWLGSGKELTVPYENIIHLRTDFSTNDLFGESNMDTLRPVMEVVGSIDSSIVTAVKNGGMLRYILKFAGNFKPEDIKASVDEFIDSFLSNKSTRIGVAGVDAKSDVLPVTPTDYVPNAVQWTNAVKRIYTFFNTNEKIITSSYTEDEWNAYYESVIEPVSLQMSNEFSRKIFSRRERGFGNKIIFASTNLQYASMSTKLGLQAMVDRGAMTPNEWRRVLNLPPIEGGEEAIRRLDTEPVQKGGNSE
ncbi:MAG: phage portal protein [Cloacibacillus sp.]